MNRPVVTMKMKNGAEIKFELYVDKAPNAANSILEMADLKGYENLAIQRIAPNYVLQPWYDEVRMDERYHYVMEREIVEDFNFEHYDVGVAGDGAEITSCGCFYFVTGDDCGSRLKGNFTGVGRVIEGFEEIDRIMNVPTRDIECEFTVKEPIEPEIVESVSYCLNGYERVPVKKRLEIF